jgi:anti-sigma regulatory factor (Ser/Thr protein kinase)
MVEDAVKEIIVPADCEQLDKVTSFVDNELDTCGCGFDIRAQMSVVIEEIFVNIAKYAYCPEIGSARIRCSIIDEPLQVVIQFLDEGKPFNLLEKETPDTALDAEEREIGGLGILIIKEQTNHVEYEYKDGKNILTVKKLLN